MLNCRPDFSTNTALPTPLNIAYLLHWHSVWEKLPSFTVGDYLAAQLVQFGIDTYFTVPGDYNLTLLDKLAANPLLTGVGCTNELNCSLAAEGYARSRNVAVCVVTYGVGALSAFNGIASGYAEGLPIILISGYPNTNDISQRKVLHHTLGNGDMPFQLEMAKRVTCIAVSITTAASAPRLIDYAMQEALRQRRPACIELAVNVAAEECACADLGTPWRPAAPGGSATAIAAAAGVSRYLSAKEKPVMVLGLKIKAFNNGDTMT